MENRDGADVCRSCGTELRYRDPEVGNPRLSGTAVAALVCGLLGPCTFGATALAGVILGAVAANQISKSRGGLRGQGAAISGLILSISILLVSPVLVMVGVPLLQKYFGRQAQATCEDHMREIYAAARLYTEEHNGRLPGAENWCDALRPQVKGVFAFSCPSATRKGGYAFNRNLSHLALREIGNPRTVPLVFDSLDGWNLSGGMEMIFPRHLGVAVLLTADGRVTTSQRGSFGDLLWEPK